MYNIDIFREPADCRDFGSLMFFEANINDNYKSRKNYGSTTPGTY